ncbi:unnamed protein product [Mytilus edulis]|uniref:Reverse transcriptase RNase H-like domain-containing protein n=1 Tax=Mytilus edulis TaxID=6550 RepID=A0A8S3RCU8_MYTED|nr:unnamed protein product [Mytilus edulis]
MRLSVISATTISHFTVELPMSKFTFSTIPAFISEQAPALLSRTFVIRTDHNSLTWLLNFKNIGGQLARWIEELSQYNMIIQHRAGKKHINADGLSRIPDDIEACRNYRPDVNLEELPCGGCKFCTRARQRLQTFEEEVDFVVPLTIRRLVDDGSYNTNWTPSYSPVELH